MQALVPIDTTKVYHEFGFDFDQVKDLELKQYFIHSDLADWFEETLDNYWESNFIKIIHKRLHHFDINHVKCVEIYYDGHELESFNFFNSYVGWLSGRAQYTMPWINDTTFYVRSEQYSLTFDSETSRSNDFHKQRILEIENDLKANDLESCLIRRYKMKVRWCEKQNLTVYEFKPNLDEDQLIRLEDIFRQFYSHSIFISEDFMFLNITEPPIVMESFVLTVFHNLLPRLTIEDILSLELANKDYRYEWHNCVLDRDIQTHLKKRLSSNDVTYNATEFTDVRLLKYFIYKYRNRFTTFELPKQILAKRDFNLIMNEHKSLKFIALSKSATRFDLISSDNITVCSVTLLHHDRGNVIVSDSIVTREIRLDSDFGDSLDDVEMVESKNLPYFIDVSIQENYKSDSLTDCLHMILRHIENYRYKTESIIQLSSYNNSISNCILNSFVKRVYDYELNFKNITFHLNRLVKWLSRIPTYTSISFTDCIFLLCEERSTMSEFIIIRKKIIYFCQFQLTFRNMEFDMPTITTLLHISQGDIVYDGCRLIPSLCTTISPTSLKTVVFKNMNIDFQALVPLLPHVKFEFDKCQIQSNDPIKHVDFITESFQNNDAKFKDMDIDAEILLHISVYISQMYLDRCRILSNENVNIPSNYLTNFEAAIEMDDVEIERKAAKKIFNRFNDIRFIGSRFVSIDNSTPKIFVKSNSHLAIENTLITPEFMKGFRYFDFHNALTFRNCGITNRILVDIWAAAPRCKRISITEPHLLDYNFYFQLIGKMYGDRIEEMHHDLKDGVAIPFIYLFDIKWNDDPSNDSLIDWYNIKVRSVLVNDVTIQFEYLRNGEVLDLVHEQNNSLDDLDICEVDYY